MHDAAPCSLPARKKSWVQNAANRKGASGYIPQSSRTKHKVAWTSYLRHLYRHADDHWLLLCVARFEDEGSENIDRIDCQPCQLAERGNRQNRPGPRRVTLIGDDLAGNP